LQELLAVLQEFTPLQATIGEAEASSANTGAIENIAAAPIARAAPVNCTLFMEIPFCQFKFNSEYRRCIKMMASTA
jgi:hypothetical protein